MGSLDCVAQQRNEPLTKHQGPDRSSCSGHRPAGGDCFSVVGRRRERLLACMLKSPGCFVKLFM